MRLREGHVTTASGPHAGRRREASCMREAQDDDQQWCRARRHPSLPCVCVTSSGTGKAWQREATWARRVTRLVWRLQREEYMTIAELLST